MCQLISTFQLTSKLSGDVGSGRRRAKPVAAGDSSSLVRVTRPATMTDYAAALDEALSTFKATGVASELPQLFSDFAHQGVDAGLSDKALTALVDLLRNK